MANSGNGRKPTVSFFLSGMFFVFSVVAGMFASYRLDTELFETLSEFVVAALSEKAGFKQVFSNAVRYDFKFSLIVLFSALSIYSSFLPLLVIGFKGFSAGLAVVIGARVIGKLSGTLAFSAAVFVSTVLTVPVYVLMFVMGYKFALRTRQIAEPGSSKIKNYMEFLLAVAILFALLCIIDCLQAFLELF